jgi:hypothetical protein
MMQIWTKSISALPYTDEVCESVVDALLQMASWDDIRPHIPLVIWNWLNKRPVLHPERRGLHLGTTNGAVQTVQALGGQCHRIILVRCLVIVVSLVTRGL